MTCSGRSILGAIVLCSVAAAGALAQSGSTAVDYKALIAAPDRTEADRRTDERRKPAQILAFVGLRPGMRVLDLAAGGGYSTELAARAVGPTGTVYGQNSPELSEKILAVFKERAKKDAMKNVVPVARNFEDPVPPEARNLDAVTFFFEYHEMPNLKFDRLAMNRKIFAALKPGGVYVVADHSAAPGAGTTVGRTLHRIEESVVRRDVEAAGFRFVAEGNFSRNPEDRRDTVVFKSPVPVDEFFLKFEKPR
jgi:predicted methyltransferase